ncbi:MAG: tetratricopeptide repeat protein [Nannocystaceae bacterium]|nr:tetratricopeptide repeat protein [bacterium]
MLAPVLAAVLATAPVASAPVDDPAEPSAAAKAAFGRAKAHAAAGRYEEAIADFEEALRLRPSPGLHYNIAVCHHRLLLAANEDSPEHEAHRAAAVTAYNAYLDAAPEAADRYAVAATIQDLHGRPNVIDEWRIDAADPGRASLELRDEPEPEPEPEPAPDPLAPPASRRPPPARSPMRPGFPHGMIGLGLSFDAPAPAAMASTAGIDSVPALGPVLRAGGFVGTQRELLIGGELAWSSTATPANRGHRITTFQVLILLDWARAVSASRRVEIGLSSNVGLGGQTMAHGTASPATCPVRASGVVSSRGGLLAGTRVLLRGVLGAKKNHALALRAGPTATLFGGGSKDSGCLMGGPSPFSEYGIPEVSLLMRADVSYAFRW